MGEITAAIFSTPTPRIEIVELNEQPDGNERFIGTVHTAQAIENGLAGQFRLGNEMAQQETVAKLAPNIGQVDELKHGHWPLENANHGRGLLKHGGQLLALTVSLAVGTMGLHVGLTGAQCFFDCTVGLGG